MLGKICFVKLLGRLKEKQNTYSIRQGKSKYFSKFIEWIVDLDRVKLDFTLIYFFQIIFSYMFFGNYCFKKGR